MYNANKPSPDELPTSAQLIKSTIIALIIAIILLVTVVLPAEHAIDPTGIGRILQLTEMGEIKNQLAEEAERDRQMDAASPEASRSTLLESIFAELFVGKAHAAEPVREAQAPAKTDEISFKLQPAEGVEWKMTMSKGAQVRYSWTVEGGVVNYDMHGTPGKGEAETSYKAARGVGADTGVLTAGFDGSHGWFFRNRGREAVTVKLKTSGAYTSLKRVR